MLSQTKYFIAQPSLLGLPWSILFSKIRKLGFDGIEVMFTKTVLRKLSYLIRLAKRNNLRITFHQPWEGEYSIINRMLWRLGVLPKNFERVAGLIPRSLKYPILVQSFRIEEAKENSNYMVQVFYSIKGKELPLYDLTRKIREAKVKVVFDILYYVEYYFKGLQHIPNNREVLLDVLLEGWKQLRRNTVEIHLYDFLPGKSFLSKNLMPGKGILPLAEFLKHLRKDNWSGRIVLEINPLQLYPNLETNLKRALHFVQRHTYESP